jgi:short-subunit dehydrogenase
LRLQGKWIVITGGSNGIGKGLAVRLAAANRVTIVSDNRDHLEAAATSIRANGGTIAEELCDIGNMAEIDALAERLLAGGDCPDVLVNNAGFGTYRAFEASSMDEIDRLLDVNFRGHVRLTKHLCDAMVRRRSGAICFMASIAGRLPITPNASYCAAKHGMIGIAEALRIELRRFGIEVTMVCPGRVDTAFFDHETFRTRTTGPENRSALTVEAAAEATVEAIEKNRRMTIFPATLAVGAWLFEALPIVARPLFELLMKSRMERLYADARR